MVALVMKIAITASVFGCGLGCRLEDVTWLWRRPGLLLRSVLAMYVVVPLVAVLMVRLLHLSGTVEAALMFLSVSAGAPLLPKKLLKLGGDPAYLTSLLVTTSLLAIVTVPLSMTALERVLPDFAAPSPGQVANLLLQSFLGPMGVGMALRAMARAFAERIGDPIMRVAGLAIVVCAALVVLAGWKEILSAGWIAVLAFVILCSAALLTGHLLGGPRPEQSTALAVSSASRHVGLALLMASGLTTPGVSGIVAAYLFAANIVSMPYLKVAGRRIAAAASGDGTALPGARA